MAEINEIITRKQLDMIREWLKADIGVDHNKRDEYYDALIVAAIRFIRRRGITLDLSKEDDIALVEMYAAHIRERRRYVGKRQEREAVVPEFLRQSLNDRLLSEKMSQQG